MTTVAGGVLSPDLRGLRNASITITDSNNVVPVATTISFGYFSFDNVPIGGTYIVTISSRRFRFPITTVQVTDGLTIPDFIGIE